MKSMEHNTTAETAEIHATDFDMLEAELKTALGDFKASMHAWSDAARSRPRMAVPTAAHHGWRWATVWALGAAMAMSGAGSGVYVHHRNQVAKEISLARRREERQRLLAAERARQEEYLLSHVDSDVSRQVPEAFEPLASLMAADEAQ